MTRTKGFSLTEMVTSLLVLGLLASLAVAAAERATAAGHAAAERVALTEGVMLALRQSAIAGDDVVLCASLGGSECTGGDDWSAGWIAFQDADGDRVRDAGERLLRRHAALDPHVHLRSSTGRTHIVFQGYQGASAGSNVTFTFCDSRGAEAATTLVLANSGRFRTAAATAAQAALCFGAG